LVGGVLTLNVLAVRADQRSPRRAALLYGINMLILLSVVWVMVFKPTL
jgi:type II secretory pathway component PulM